MKRLHFWAVTAAVMLASCANEEIEEQSNLPSDNERKTINVTTYTPQVTRAYDATQATIDSLKADGGSGFTLLALNGSDTIIGGVKYYVTDNEGACVASDNATYYWPEEASVSFYAYYPAASTTCTLDARNSVLYILPNGKTDVMAANATASAASNDGSVSLQFKHLLAQVVVNVACSDDVANASFSLDSLSITAPTSATYNFSDGSITGNASVSDAFPFVVKTESKTLSTTAQKIGTAMLAASDAENEVRPTYVLTVGYKVTIGNNNSKDYLKTANINLVAGYMNTINVTVSSDKPISVTASVKEWSDGAPQEISWAGMMCSGSADGHNYVDLGLPSGTLWATCNIGAESPEEYGDYYAWGETTPHYSVNGADTTWLDGYSAGYDWSTYKHCEGSNTTMTKYCTNSKSGTVDNKTVLETDDDAATANWGSAWRMPTQEEWQELLDNTTSKWMTMNGVNGRKITASNGNYIFLPAVGFRQYTKFDNTGSYNYYWSASLYEGTLYAWTLCLSSSDVSMSYNALRFCGLSVRAVRSAE